MGSSPYRHSIIASLPWNGIVCAKSSEGSSNMATGMFGADVERLMEFSDTFEMRRETVDHARSVVGPAIESVEWYGKDAETYKTSYGESIPKALEKLSDVLVTRHDDVSRQAQDQEETSKPKGGEGCLDKIKDFFSKVFNAIKDFVNGFVGGFLSDLADLARLAGFDPDNGFDWSLDTLKNSWGETLDGLAGLVGYDPDTGEFSRDTARDTWGALKDDLLARETRERNKAEGYGEATWNFLSMLIPVADIAKAAKSAKSAGSAGSPDGPDAPDRTDSPDSKGEAPEEAARPTKPEDADGGAPQNLPDSVSQQPDGTITTPVGDIPVDRQHNNIEPGSPELNRNVKADGETHFEPNSSYTTPDGQFYVTDEHGQVVYASTTRKGSDLLPVDRSGMGDPARDYATSDEGDVRGHHNPAFLNSTNDNINLDPQSPGANGGHGRGVNSANPQPHQHIMEHRTREYMMQNPDVDVTWERKTNYDYSGTPETNPNYGHATDYGTRVSQRNEDGSTSILDLNRNDRMDLTPGPDGFVPIQD